MDFLYSWTISSFPIVEIKNIPCGKEPMLRNNEVHYSSYAEHYLIGKYVYSGILILQMIKNISLQMLLLLYKKNRNREIYCCNEEQTHCLC